MGKLPGVFIVPLVLLGMASAQIPEDAWRSKVTGVRYAPIAAEAHFQGDVRLSLRAGVVTFLSGPPLLAQTAIESAKALISIERETNLDLTYHFVLVNTTTVPMRTIVQRGNPFERAILRMLGLKTEKVIVDYGCQQGVPPSNDFKIASASIEIWIYGSASCPTVTGALIAKG